MGRNRESSLVRSLQVIEPLKRFHNAAIRNSCAGSDSRRTSVGIPRVRQSKHEPKRASGGSTNHIQLERIRHGALPETAQQGHLIYLVDLTFPHVGPHCRLLEARDPLREERPEILVPVNSIQIGKVRQRFQFGLFAKGIGILKFPQTALKAQASHFEITEVKQKGHGNVLMGTSDSFQPFLNILLEVL